LKNNNGIFFFVGIIIGIALLFSAVNYQKFFALTESSQGHPLTPTPVDTLPRLLALESANTVARPTQASTPTISIQLSPTPGKNQVNPTATLLFLQNEQRLTTIGTSAKGLPLQVYSFGSGKHERMIVAGIHGGDEWNTIALANQLIVYINQSPTIIPNDVTLYILPDLNPDGEARSHDKYGRLNGNGVDLNRNFPTNWQATWDLAGCWNYLPTSGGSEAGSEPETRALMTFIESHNIEALISYHSAALGIFPGGDPWDANSVRFAKAIAGASSYPFPPIDTGCIYTGTLADYASSRGSAAVDLELTDHYDTGFATNLNILQILLTWQP
jgi:predicted deacylase